MTATKGVVPADVTGDDDGRQERWTDQSVRPDDINRRLTRLWLQQHGPRPLRLTTSASDRTSESELVPVSGTFARTNTINLIICARSAAQGERARAALAGLATHYPTRAVVVVSSAERDQRRGGVAVGEPPTLELTASLMRHERGDLSAGFFEAITIEAGPRALGNPVHYAGPLAMPDLPVFVWWTGDLQYDLGVFTDLASSSDRTIVDSAAFGDVGRGLTALAELVVADGQQPVLSDLAWARLRDWRHLIAQFFDAPGMLDAISEIDSLTIDYVPEASARYPVAGTSSSMLLVSWLASRLEWRLDERLARTESGLRMVFSGRRGGSSVIVRLRPATPEVAPIGIGRAIMTVGGDTSHRFAIEQVSLEELRTTSAVGDAAPTVRRVAAMATSDAVLLEGELQQFARDHIYESALTTAAQIFSRR